MADKKRTIKIRAWALLDGSFVHRNIAGMEVYEERDDAEALADIHLKYEGGMPDVVRCTVEYSVPAKRKSK